MDYLKSEWDESSAREEVRAFLKQEDEEETNKEISETTNVVNS